MMLASKSFDHEVKNCAILSEDDIWGTPGVTVWRTEQFEGQPFFYPVYRYQDYYSYSPLPLILLKKTLALNREVAECSTRGKAGYYSGPQTVDREIERIGGPPRRKPVIRRPEELVRTIVPALRDDVRRTEEMNPGFANIIMCGGKDSLNLLLLPWQNPVLVVSGPPNYELVRAFISDNGLPFNVLELTDGKDESIFRAEALANCCLIDLIHFRWGAHLKELSMQFDRRAIFWLGSLGDVLFSPRWKTYKHCRNSRVARVVLRAEQLLPRTLLEGREARRFAASCWYRGAMWQGVYHSILRHVTGCLVLSGYHGPSARRVFAQVHHPSTNVRDLRPEIGCLLRGSQLNYPAANPGPPVSEIREGLAQSTVFLSHLEGMGVRIV